MTKATSPVLIILTDRDRAELETVARARKAPLRSVQRAWIVLAAADGCPTRRSPEASGCMRTRWHLARVATPAGSCPFGTAPVHGPTVVAGRDWR
jgi:hypothetical protein